METKTLNKLSKEGREEIIELEGKLRDVREKINFIDLALNSRDGIL